MALLKIEYKSEVLRKQTGINIIIPEKRDKGKKLPVLYLLHGFSGNENSWYMQTSLQRYAQYKDIAIVMPDAFNSFYTNMACGAYDFYTFFFDELMPFCNGNFFIAQDREHTFIAGLSMGGYGAFKLAFLKPKIFGAAASFSGCMDIKSHTLKKEHDFTPVFGDKLSKEEDLFYLSSRVSSESIKPRIYQWCGTEDYLYSENVRFKNHIQALGFDYTYKQSRGTHEWQYWDDQIKRLFIWLGIHNKQQQL